MNCSHEEFKTGKFLTADFLSILKVRIIYYVHVDNEFVKTHPTTSILLDFDYSSKREDRETRYSAYFVGLYPHKTRFQQQQIFQRLQIQRRT